MRQRLVACQHIIGVQDSHDIARRHLDALVDGIIHAVVFFRKPTEVEVVSRQSLVVGFVSIFFDYIDRTVS